MKIAVIDDERPARRELIRQIQETMPDCEIKEADSGAGALELFNTEDDFDILFVDINLNDMEGTTLAATARKLLPKAKIVFATAYSQYAAKAFEMEIDDYILKPFDPDRVRHVLEKCVRGLEQQQETERQQGPGAKDKEKPELEVQQAAVTAPRIPVPVNHSIRFLDVPQIVYAETQGRGILLHTRTGSYEVNQLLGDLEKKLQPYGFFRIHKSYLVNLECITEMFPWTGNGLAMKLKGYENTILPVGRERLKTLKQILNI